MSSPVPFVRIAAVLSFVTLLFAGGCSGGYATLTTNLIPDSKQTPLWPGKSPVSVVVLDPLSGSVPDLKFMPFSSTVFSTSSGPKRTELVLVDPEGKATNGQLDQEKVHVATRTFGGRLEIGEIRAAPDIRLADLAGLRSQAGIPGIVERFGSAVVFVTLDPRWTAKYCDANQIRWIDPASPGTGGVPGLIVLATPTRDEAQAMIAAAARLERADVCGAPFLLIPDRYDSIEELRDSASVDHRQALRRYETLAKAYLARRKAGG